MATPPPTSSDPTNPPAENKSRRAALFLVFIVVFIDLLGFGIVLPLLPLYAQDLLKPLLPSESHRIVRGMILGLLMSSFSAMQFLFAPIWGRISDRVGRRPILLLGLAGSVVFYALFGVASELGNGGWIGTALALMFVARIGAGIAGATIATAQAVIADCTPANERSRGMALIGAAFGIGFTFGPLLGFASIALHLAGAPGFVAAGVSLLALALAAWKLPETLKSTTTGLRRNWIDWSSLRRALATPTVGSLIVTFFLATFAFGSLEATLSLFNRTLLLPSAAAAAEVTPDSERGLDQQNFLIFAYVGFNLMLVQGVIYRPLAKRVSEMVFLRVGLAILAAGMICACAAAWGVYAGTIARGPSAFYVALPVLTIAVTGFAFMNPSVASLISRRSDPSQQGEILGANQSASALARILGPFIGLSAFHVDAAHITPYALSALLLVVVFWKSLRLR
jgi:MFS transporter, DHA1 family, tetracycline resistance protein